MKMFDFKHAAKALCGRASSRLLPRAAAVITAGAFGAGMLGAQAQTVSYPNIPFSNAIAQNAYEFKLTAGGVITAASPAPSVAPAAPITMGGYSEGDSDAIVENIQKEYLSEKAQLKAAMLTCEPPLPGCDPRIDHFSKMIEQVRKIPDRLTQAEIVNAWGNTYIEYDEVEAMTLNPPDPNAVSLIRAYALKRTGFASGETAWAEYGNTESLRAWIEDNKDKIAASANPASFRTLENSLIDRKGVCNERARLKLLALEELGFDEKDIRLVVEEVYIDGKKESAHAVVEVRIDDKIWVMNNTTRSFSREDLPEEVIIQEITNVSTLEADTTQLNFSRHSTLMPINWTFVPIYEFNSTQSARYKSSAPFEDLSNVPEITRNAAAVATSLTAETLKQINGTRIMASAFSPYYEVAQEAPEPSDGFSSSRQRSFQAQKFSF